MMRLVLSLAVGVFVFMGLTAPNPREYVRPVGTDKQFVGSAVIIAPGKLVTAAHVAKVATTVFYKGHLVQLHIEYINEQEDIAVMNGLGIECPCAPIDRSTLPQDALIEKIGYADFPNVGVQILTEGRVQGYSILEDDDHKPAHKLIHTAPTAPGDSGGGIFAFNLFHLRYELVGITSEIAALNDGFFRYPVFHLARSVPIDVLPNSY